MKKGFTLIELSIVLVIIGLLVGGILVGQSLVESVRIQSTIKTIQQFDSASDLFKSKFKGLPGDAKSFGGDGNGWITSLLCIGWGEPPDPTNHYYSRARCQVGFSGEIGKFWSDLKIAGLNGEYKNSYSGSLLVTSGSEKNVPLMPIGKNVGAVAFTAFSSSGSYMPDSFAGKPFFMLLSADAKVRNSVNGDSIGTDGDSAALTTSQTLALDQKLDDAIPTTGYLMVGQIGGLGEFTVGINNSENCISSATQYNLTNQEVACSPVMMFNSYR